MKTELEQPVKGFTYKLKLIINSILSTDLSYSITSITETV